MWCGVLLLSLLALAGSSQAATLRLYVDYAHASDPAVQLRVDRQPKCQGNFLVLGTIQPLQGEPLTYVFDDTTLQLNQTTCWQVVAVNTAGMVSGPSNVLTLRCQQRGNRPLTCTPA